MLNTAWATLLLIATAVYTCVYDCDIHCFYVCFVAIKKDMSIYLWLHTIPLTTVTFTYQVDYTMLNKSQ